MRHCTAEGKLNVTGIILSATVGLSVNKMQSQGCSRMECRKKAKASKDPNAKVETFTSIDRSGKNIIDQNGTRHSAVIYLVVASDGTEGKYIDMSAQSQMKLKMQ
jgi:hypothetical protein